MAREHLPSGFEIGSASSWMPSSSLHPLCRALKLPRFSWSRLRVRATAVIHTFAAMEVLVGAVQYPGEQLRQTSSTIPTPYPLLYSGHLVVL